MDSSSQFAWYMTALLGLVVMGWIINSFVRYNDCFLGALYRNAAGGLTTLIVISTFLGGLGLYITALVVLFGKEYFSLSYELRAMLVIGYIVPVVLVGFLAGYLGKFVNES